MNLKKYGIKFDSECILYHGSRGGIEGDIQPISRVRCDFGRGFYLGTLPIQVKSLVVEDSFPMFYEIKADFSSIPPEKILVLENMDWVYTVLGCRKYIDESECFKEYRERLNNYDLVIGLIADDRMNYAMKAFSNMGLTNRGLEECLKCMDYGLQIVCKTQRACDCLSILSSHHIDNWELQQVAKFSRDNKAESFREVNDIRKKFQREGYFLHELIEQGIPKPGIIKEVENVKPNKGRRL